MDFKKLEGLIFEPDNLVPDNEQLRCSLYIEFSNTESLQKLLTSIITAFKKHIEENLLPQNYDQDILYMLFKKNKYRNTMEETGKMDVKVSVHSWPMFPVVHVAPSLRRSHQIIGKMDTIGYQHLYILSKTVDASESSNAESSDSDLEAGDVTLLKKKLKTYRKALEADCESLLKYHDENLTQITGDTVHVDVLIFLDKSVCKRLSKYLGLIYVEDLLTEAGEDDMNSVLRRLDDKSAKLYKLVQFYINKKLITGCNNICLVHTLPLWKNICANFRGVISDKSDKLFYLEPTKTTNVLVELGQNPTILSYIEAVSNVIDGALSFDSHVVAKYQCGNDSYCNVKLSLVSIVPWYILKYFTQGEIRKQKHKFN